MSFAYFKTVHSIYFTLGGCIAGDLMKCSVEFEHLTHSTLIKFEEKMTSTLYRTGASRLDAS